MAKSPIITVRASAVLPASGAYDSSPTTIEVDFAREVEVYITYTRGAAGGAFQVKVLTSADNVTFCERTVIDGNSLASGAMNVYTASYKFPVAASGSAENRSLIVNVNTTKFIQFVFAEYGVTGTPGTLAAVAVTGD